jgi:hypothetical protein
MGSLWLGTGRTVLRTGTASGSSASPARHARVRATVLPRAVDRTPTRTVVGPSGPARPPAVDQVRAVDAARPAHRCDEPWCNAAAPRAGTLCAEHYEQRKPRARLDAIEGEQSEQSSTSSTSSTARTSSGGRR